MLKLHLGCGPHIKEGWENLDIQPGAGGKIHDLKKPLPYETASVSYIFTEHFIEHLNRAEGLAFLKECQRVLKRGGVLRISTPDLDALCDLYKQEKIDLWAPSWTPKTPCQMFNEGMREWGHLFLYDYSELYKSLDEVGFKEILPAPYQVSSYTELCNLEIRPWKMDLIMEAYKW